MVAKNEPEVQAALDEQSGNLDKLPGGCYGVLESAILERKNAIIWMKRGMMGYYDGCVDTSEGVTYEEASAVVNALNERLGVTVPQRMAMEAGSMFGFHIPAADPDLYDDTGLLK